MRPARVLIVDDSAMIRRLLRKVLESDPEVEVAGTAENGVIALKKIESIKPDLVLLDVNMPELDGLSTLSKIRETDKKLPVVMFSDVTQRGAEATLDALLRGANCYVPKSGDLSDPSEAVARLQRDLMPKIKALVNQEKSANEEVRKRKRTTGKQNRIRAICISASTGGPPAVQKVLTDLPKDLEMPIYIAQHMPPLFTKTYADRLAASSGRDVREGEDGAIVGRGSVWVAPGDYHMVMRRKGTSTVIRLNQDEKVHSCRPAADIMLKSALDLYGGNLLSVVLTGMGYDGAEGSELIHDAGGYVIAQDEASSAVWGMPGAVAKRGVADEILPLDKIAAAIATRTMTSRSAVSGAA